MVLIDWLKYIPCRYEVYCFRPLAGIMVLIKANKKWLAKNYEVSVPLRGLWFLSVTIIKSLIKC